MFLGCKFWEIAKVIFKSCLTLVYLTLFLVLSLFCFVHTCFSFSFLVVLYCECNFLCFSFSLFLFFIDPNYESWMSLHTSHASTTFKREKKRMIKTSFNTAIRCCWFCMCVSWLFLFKDNVHRTNSIMLNIRIYKQQ